MKFVAINEVKVRVLGNCLFHVLASNAVVLLIGNEIILVLVPFTIVVRVEPIFLFVFLFCLVSAVWVTIVLLGQITVIDAIIFIVILWVKHLFTTLRTGYNVIFVIPCAFEVNEILTAFNIYSFFVTMIIAGTNLPCVSFMVAVIFLGFVIIAVISIR